MHAEAVEVITRGLLVCVNALTFYGMDLLIYSIVCMSQHAQVQSSHHKPQLIPLASVERRSRHSPTIYTTSFQRNEPGAAQVLGNVRSTA